jgi:hypothetical protein
VPSTAQRAGGSAACGTVRAPSHRKVYAALALEPPLGFVSELELELLASDDDDGDFLSSLFVLSVSVFAGDFASLEPDFASLLEGFAEP